MKSHSWLQCSLYFQALRELQFLPCTCYPYLKFESKYNYYKIQNLFCKKKYSVKVDCQARSDIYPRIIYSGQVAEELAIANKIAILLDNLVTKGPICHQFRFLANASNYNLVNNRSVIF